jgi:hypothetical protein
MSFTASIACTRTAPTSIGHPPRTRAFCYVAPREGFCPIAPEAIGVPVFDSFAIAVQACRRSGLDYLTSSPPGAWLKVLGPGHHAHYEFKDGSLSLVTLMLRGGEA